MKFKLLLLPLMILVSSSVFAEPVKDTPLNATVSGVLHSFGSTVQNIADTWKIPVNPEARKSVETVEGTFVDNPTLFKVGSTVGDVAQVTGLPAVGLTLRTTKVTVIGMELTKDSIKAGEKYIKNQLKKQGLNRSVQVGVE